MTPARFRNWRIRTKLISVTLFLVLLPLLLVAPLSINRFNSALRSASEEDLEHLVRNLYAMCKIQQDMVQKGLASDLNVARERLRLNAPEITVDPENAVRFSAVDRSTGKIFNVSVPSLKSGGVALTGDTRFVDGVRNLLGGACSVYQTVDGRYLLNVSTTLLLKDGQRDVGGVIPPESPVTNAVLAGEPFRGRAYLADDWYICLFEPIRTGDGRVAGALSVGVREQNARTLRDEIKQIKVGDTGYVYIIDSQGLLRIHPAKEGENILHAKDSTGYEYIRAMIAKAVSLKEGQSGTDRYPWLNPELGEKKPRQKIAKYVYFKPWDWIIVAGSYEDEIYKSPHATERFIVMTTLVSVALVLILVVAFSRFLTRPIRDLTAVTAKMAEGDLSQRVEVESEDEIGVLGISFNRMIAQLQAYTSSLEEMVEGRTLELKESKERYRDLSRFLNSILDSATFYGIMALDYDGKVIEFNKGAERLFGWRKEEVVNKENIGVTILPDDKAKGLQEEISRRTRTEGVCELEMVRVDKNGRRFPVHSTVTVIRDPAGKATGFVEIARDITVRKTLERQLRETKEFLENIMESSVDGIVTTDLKGKITFLNRSMEKMLDYRREELLGRHISSVYERGIELAREIMKILTEDERAENFQMEVKRKSGDVLTITNSIFLVRDGGGQVIGTAGIFKDVTEQKRLEAQLREAQVNLIEASKMRALGELVAGVAHELNNPLMASQTILHVIFKNLHKDCPNEDRLKLIRKCNDRIEKIVEHLREFARQTKSEFKALEINQPIENALLITGQQLLDHGIAIVRNLAEGLPEVLGDVNQLEQVFLNLISNAKDAMDGVEGKKELTISSYLPTEARPSVAVSLRDTGMGIPQENLDKVLEPFFTTKPVGKGTGLGLSLCFGILEAHGGQLEIKSEEGKGTEVKITLPAI